MVHIKRIDEMNNTEWERVYTAEDFDTSDAPIEMVQYIIDNVDDFTYRYDKALDVIDQRRCSLDYADNDLYNDIYDMASEWCSENNENVDDYDIESIFVK